MRFKRFVTTAVGAGLLSLPVVALGAAPAQAASPYETRLSIQRSNTAQLFNRNVQFGGLLERYNDDDAPVWEPVNDALQTVTLQRRFAGAANFKSVATDTIDSSGLYLFTTPALANASYRVVFAGGSYQGDPAAVLVPSTSSNLGLKVARDLGAKRKELNGGKFRFFGKVRPNYSRKKIVLQKQLGKGPWRTIDSEKTTKRGGWAFIVHALPRKGVVRYRTFTPKDKKFIKSYSATFRITTI